MLKEEDPIMCDSDYSPTMDTLFMTASQLSLNLEEIANIDEHMLATLPIVDQEETMDVATKFVVLEPTPPEVFIPVSKRGTPERRVEAGLLNFQVEINGSDTHKRKYLYSNRLNRIYVDMKVEFSVQFRWDWARAPAPMYVRATVVFSDEAQAEKRVERCTQHTHEPGHDNISMSVIKNVLHSSRDMSTPGVYYCGHPDQADSWYSVLVEFPGLTPGPYRHAYQFVCKNSCSSGINRRAIDIIFELEDSTGAVHGRQTVGARACSCPMRDLRTDEAKDGTGGKRRVAATEQHKSKKVKIETVTADDDLFTLPAITVVGVQCMITGLMSMLGVMEFEATSNPEKHKAYIDTLKRQIAYYKGLKTQQ